MSKYSYAYSHYSLEITFMYSLAFQNLAPQPWNLRHWSTWISTLPLRKRWEKRLICMANPTLGRAELHSLHERNRTVCTIPRTRAPQTPLASQTVQVTSNSCSYWKTYLLKHQKISSCSEEKFLTTRHWTKPFRKHHFVALSTVFMTFLKIFSFLKREACMNLYPAVVL